MRDHRRERPGLGGLFVRRKELGHQAVLGRCKHGVSRKDRGTGLAHLAERLPFPALLPVQAVELPSRAHQKVAQDGITLKEGAPTPSEACVELPQPGTQPARQGGFQRLVQDIAEIRPRNLLKEQQVLP
ncbi:hypothetical protein kuro4_27530 [Gelria sp. Kuro-4]|nr:hypothetical protein kuro4_27530 [Gelria sp. Kuro-4]